MRARALRSKVIGRWSKLRPAHWALIVALVVGAAAVIAAVTLTSPGARATDKSIAILPFENRSLSKADDEYGDWLSELISSLLGKASDLRVISQTSASVFKGKAVALPDIAKQLRVALVVEGSVRSEGEDIVISAQLIDAATDTQVWGQVYERKNDNALGVQSEIAAKVAGAVAAALDVTLAQSEQQQTLSPTAVPKAFEAYQTALKLYRTTSEANMRSAQRLLNEAVDTDTDFALA
jgi:adenylate cyclase